MLATQTKTVKQLSWRYTYHYWVARLCSRIVDFPLAMARRHVTLAQAELDRIDAALENKKKFMARMEEIRNGRK